MCYQFAYISVLCCTYRIQPGDMLLEVGGRGTVGGALEHTIDLLKEATESIKLKVARPDPQTSVFAAEGGDEVGGVCCSH